MSSNSLKSSCFVLYSSLVSSIINTLVIPALIPWHFSIIIYIDHSTIVSILQQINFITFNINKLNLRFIKISQYFFEFNLQMKHKVKKFNVISNVFSRLQTDVIINEKIDVFETFYEVFIQLCDDDLTIVFSKSLSIYHIILIELTNEFKIRLKKIYNKNDHWFKILKMFISKIKKKSFFRSFQLWKYSINIQKRLFSSTSINRTFQFLSSLINQKFRSINQYFRRKRKKWKNLFKNSFSFSQ